MKTRNDQAEQLPTVVETLKKLEVRICSTETLDQSVLHKLHTQIRAI